MAQIQFTGKVERFDGDVVYLTLTDEKKRKAHATCQSQHMEQLGLGEGDHFYWILDVDQPEKSRFEPKPRRVLSDEEWQAICKDVESALGDYEPQDD